MDCECIAFYSPIKKNLLRYCPDCDKSIGGTIGNVSHNHGCKNYNCKHQRYYGTRMRELIFEREVYEWYYGPFEISGFYWSEEEEKQEKIIIEFQKTLYKEIKNKLLDLDRKLFERVQNVIRLKTNRHIYVPYLTEK